MFPNLLAQLAAKDTNKNFFNAVRYKRQQDLVERKMFHSWEKNSHKLYPSSIKSLTMCPHRFIQEDVHKPPSFTPQVVYSLELGKAVHNMLQTEGDKIEGLYWAEPDYSQYALTSYNLMMEMMEKRKLIHPEVPVWDPLSGISGRADMVLDLGGEPVVFDIKTTSVEPDKWATKTADLPSEEHKIQVGIYCHLMNKFKLYSKPVRKGGLGYLNMLLKPGDPDAEYEVYFDFDSAFEQRIALLVEHLGIQRQQYLSGHESKCEYPYCRAHNLKKTLEDAKHEMV